MQNPEYMLLKFAYVIRHGTHTKKKNTQAKPVFISYAI